MKSFLRYIFLSLLFWILLFAIQRTVFLVYNYEQLTVVSWKEIMFSYWYGLRMDLSTTAFLITFPLIFGLINLFVAKKIWVRLSDIFTLFLVVIVLLIGIVDTGLYSNWGSKINAKAISYILFPEETFAVVTTVPVWLFAIIFVAETFLAFWVYLKWVRIKKPEKSKALAAGLAALILLAALPVAYRGGLQKYPMGRRYVYYSRYMVLNYAALNSIWNTADVLLRARKTENPYRYFDTAQAKLIFDAMHTRECDSTLSVLNNPRPNILLILIESCSAENLLALGGKESGMPNLEKLTEEGLLFTRMYASGFRTEQGLISLISSFPAQPTVTLMREFGKFENLPNLGRQLNDLGYTLNYYYAGNLEFANTGAYLRISSFTKLTGRDNRPWKKFSGYGAMDEELFRCHLNEVSQDKQPFFTIIMTSTSHEPFDAEVTEKYPKNDAVNLYRNTLYYTDSCLGEYINQVRKTEWYHNTLIIISADHAHFFPQNRKKYEPERHHIPFLFLGGALKEEWKGKRINRIGSQVDFAATILSQLGVKNAGITYSRNLLNPCEQQFAFYAFDNGFGVVAPEGSYVFDHDMQKILLPENPLNASDSLWINRGKAYLQLMYDKYLEINN